LKLFYLIDYIFSCRNFKKDRPLASNFHRFFRSLEQGLSYANMAAWLIEQFIDKIILTHLFFNQDVRHAISIFSCFTVFHSEPASALSLLTVWSLWGNPVMARCWRKSGLSCWIHPAAQSTLGEQQWDSLVSEHSVDFQIKIGRPKFYAGEMITPA
jgi:hypothetical protein